MGEWSEYFTEENPANYDKRGRYDPPGSYAPKKPGKRWRFASSRKF